MQHSKYTALHEEYRRNRLRYDPVFETEEEEVSQREGKKLGLIDIQSIIHCDDYIFPMEDTITSTDYPEQDEEQIGQTYALWYMLENDTHEKEYGEFTVVRWDNEDPGIVMLVNDNKKMILVALPEWVLPDGTETEDELGRKVYNSHIHSYPTQMGEIIGLLVRDMYFKDPQYNYGVIIRADAGGDHPQYVILETLRDDSFRLITFKEAKAISSLYDINANNIDNDEYWPDDWRNLKGNEKD